MATSAISSNNSIDQKELPSGGFFILKTKGERLKLDFTARRGV
jgi:hypothetical protein